MRSPIQKNSSDQYLVLTKFRRYGVRRSLGSIDEDPIVWARVDRLRPIANPRIILCYRFQCRPSWLGLYLPDLDSRLGCNARIVFAVRSCGYWVF